jgi:hypothetical protein
MKNGEPLVKERTNEDMMDTCRLMYRLGFTFSFWGGGVSPHTGLQLPIELIMTAGHVYDYFKRPKISQILPYERYLHIECGDYLGEKVAGNGMIQSFEKGLCSEKSDRWADVSRLLTWLEIPFEPIMSYPGGYIDTGSVSVYDVYDIIMDEKRFNRLLSKLNLKAFW